MKISETRSFDQIDMNLEILQKLTKDNVPCPIPIPLTKQYHNENNHEFICKLNRNIKELKIYCISYIDGDTVGMLTKSLFEYKDKHIIDRYDDWDIINIEELFKE